MKLLCTEIGHARFELRRLKIEIHLKMEEEGVFVFERRNLRSSCLLLWHAAGFPHNCSSSWSLDQQMIQLLEMAKPEFTKKKNTHTHMCIPISPNNYTKLSYAIFTKHKPHNIKKKVKLNHQNEKPCSKVDHHSCNTQHTLTKPMKI